MGDFDVDDVRLAADMYCDTCCGDCDSCCLRDFVNYELDILLAKVTEVEE